MPVFHHGTHLDCMWSRHRTSNPPSGRIVRCVERNGCPHLSSAYPPVAPPKVGTLTWWTIRPDAGWLMKQY